MHVSGEPTVCPCLQWDAAPVSMSAASGTRSRRLEDGELAATQLRCVLLVRDSEGRCRTCSPGHAGA